MKKTKLRESARGEECALQIHPYCNGDRRTTVLCHLPSNAGMANKSSDLFAVYGCSACHDIVDRRFPQAVKNLSKEEILLCILRAINRTHQRMIEKGLINVSG